MAVSAGLAHDVCNWTQPGYVDQVNTENTARDLNVARQALGLDKLNLYGVSYGGLLALSLASPPIPEPPLICGPAAAPMFVLFG